MARVTAGRTTNRRTLRQFHVVPPVIQLMNKQMLSWGQGQMQTVTLPASYFNAVLDHTQVSPALFRFYSMGHLSHINMLWLKFWKLNSEALFWKLFLTSVSFPTWFVFWFSGWLVGGFFVFVFPTYYTCLLSRWCQKFSPQFREDNNF